MTDSKNSKIKHPSVWVFSTYFAQGMPFGVIRSLASVFFTDIGMKNAYIGYLNFLGIPWNLKFIWAPLVDLLGTRRRWMLIMQLLLTLGFTAIAVICGIIDQIPSPHLLLAVAAATLIVLAFIAATNDIAIDGFFIEALPDKGDQAAYTGYRVMAWRLAFLLVRSGFVGLAAFAATTAWGAGTYRPWAFGFGVAALTLLITTIVNMVSTSSANAEKRVLTFSQSLHDYGRAFICWLDQKKIATVILFIIFYKIGDEILFSMGTPFLMRELHATKAQMAWLAGIVGMTGSIAGTMIAGWWIKKQGLKKAIWPLTLLMNINIWAYIWLAYIHPSATDSRGIVLIAAVHCYEQMAAGLGNAVLIVFILRTCKAEFKAAHYAIGSAIMSLPSTFIGGFGGQIVDAMGYLNMFLLAFCVSIPSMALLFFVPISDTQPAKTADRTA